MKARHLSFLLHFQLGSFPHKIPLPLCPEVKLKHFFLLAFLIAGKSHCARFCNLFTVPWRGAISVVGLILSLCNMLCRVSKVYKVLHELFGPEALHKEIMQTEWHPHCRQVVRNFLSSSPTCPSPGKNLSADLLRSLCRERLSC